MILTKTKRTSGGGKITLTTVHNDILNPETIRRIQALEESLLGTPGESEASFVTLTYEGVSGEERTVKFEDTHRETGQERAIRFFNEHIKDNPHIVSAWVPAGPGGHSYHAN